MPIYKDIVLRFGGDSTKLEQSMSKLSRNMGKVSAVTAGLGRYLTAGVTVPLTGLAAASVKTAVEYESAFAGVQKTVNATDEELDKLYDSTLALSETIPVSATTLMSIEELGGQLGISTGNLLGFTETIAGLGEATNMTVEDAATQFAQFANITGMSQSEFGRLGSTLVDLGNNAATTEADIMNMAMRIAGAGTSAGMSVTDVMALSTTLSSLGINAEAGGTAISTIIANIDKQVATNGKNLETWASTAGMSAQDFAKAWADDPVVALQAVIEGMASMQGEGGNLSVLLEELGVSSIRQTDAFKRMANSGDLFNQTLDRSRTAWEQNSALTDETARRYETTESKMQLLRNQVENVAAKLGGPLAEALTDILEDISPVIDAAADLAQGFADMDTDSQNFIIGLGGFAAAAGPVSTFVSKVTGGIGGFATKVRKASEDMAKVGTAADKSAKLVEGVGTAAATADAAVTMKTAKSNLDETKTKAKGAAKAIDGDATSITKAASNADGISMSKATKAVEGVGDSAGTAAKALHGGADALDAAASTADAAITMSTAKSNIGDVETKAKGAAGAIDGDAKSITKAANAADKVKLSTVAKEVESVGTKATGAANAIGTGSMFGLKGALIALGGFAVIGALALVYNHFKDLETKAARLRDLSEGVKGKLEDIGTVKMDDAKTSVQTLRDDTGKLLENVTKSADKTLELYENLANQDFDTNYSIGQVEQLASTIKDLGSKDELSSREQYELNRAVERFESITGQTISTVKNGNVELTKNAEAIDAITDAYRRQLKQNAFESALNDIYTQQAEAYRNLTDARKANADAMKAYETAVNNEQVALQQGEDAYYELAGAINETGNATEDAHWAVIDADAALNNSNEALQVAQTEYDGLCDSVEFYEGELFAVIGTTDETTDSTEESTEAIQQQGEAAEEAADDLKEYTTQGGLTVTTTESMANALSKAEGHFTEISEKVRGMGGDIQTAIMNAGYGIEEFALMVESAGGGLDHFAAVYNAMSQLNDPFATMEVSSAGTRNAVYEIVDGVAQITNEAQETDEIYANITDSLDKINQYNNVIADLYSQAESQADIDFIDSLVEKGPQALGELQNIAGQNGAVRVSLHELADAQAQLDATIAGTAVNAEIQRMAAEYRNFGIMALDSAYLVDESTGNIITAIGDGADQMIVTINGATGEIVSQISATAPEAKEAAEELAAKANEGLDGIEDDFSDKGASAGQQLAEGMEGTQGEVTASSTYLGDEAYNALVSLPDEMQARGAVAGSSLGYGIWQSRTQVSNYAKVTVQAAIDALGSMSDDAHTKGRAVGVQFRAGVQSQSGNSYDAGYRVGSNALSGLGAFNIEAYWSGVEMAQNFSGGISGQESAARAAAQKVANAVASFLHFSEPDEGPLVGINSSGAEMVQNFANSMLSQEQSIRAASKRIASAASLTGSLADTDSLSLPEPIYNVFNLQATVREEADIQKIATAMHRLQVQQARNRR